MLHWGKPTHLGYLHSSELPGGEGKSADLPRLRPPLSLEAQAQGDLNSVSEPLAGVIGDPAGKAHPMRKDESGLGLKRHSGCRLPQQVCWAVRTTLGIKPSSLSGSSMGKVQPGAIEMFAALPTPRELSLLGLCESQCCRSPKELKWLRQQEAAVSAGCPSRREFGGLKQIPAKRL